MFKRPKISAVITCAGNGCRFGHNKLLMPLAGKPVFVRTVEQFAKAKNIDEILVAIREGERKIYERWLKKEGLVARLVIGGAERHISAYNCVKVASGDYIVCHDGARPLIETHLIEKIAAAVLKHQAVMLAVETHTSIKKIGNGFIDEHLERKETWLAQTPQAFRRDLLKLAFEKVIKKGEMVCTDDSELVGRLGIKVKMLPGDLKNIKITVPLDLILVRAIYKNWQGGKNNEGGDRTR